MMNQYERKDDTSMVKKLKKYPIFRSESAYKDYFNSSIRDTAMHNLGIGTTRRMRSVITGLFLPSLKCSTYTPLERINIWRGKKFLQNTPLEQEVEKFDAFSEVRRVKIPIYFIGGIFDYTCNYSLQKEYFELIESPKKAFYSFNNSAHSPLYEESKKCLSIILKHTVNNTE